MNNALRLTQLTTGYGKKVVSEGLNASLEGGLLTCLLGPNGAGKSTLMRTLCGFQPPLAGEVSIDGATLSALSPTRLAKTVGVVLTERVNAPAMTLRALVELGRSPYTGFFGTLRGDDRAAVAEAIHTLGLDGLSERPIASLSDGERQKAMIAKALAQQTPYILLDEPTAFLDFPSSVDIMLLLRRLAHTTGRAILLSTHALDLALQTADRLWLLTPQGLEEGTPRELITPLNQLFAGQHLRFDKERMHFEIDYSHDDWERGVYTRDTPPSN